VNKPTPAAVTALLSLAALLLLVSASMAQDATQAAPAAAVAPQTEIPKPVVGADYRITEEDVLRMDIWGEPQLSNMQMQVTPDGKINVPYINEMIAAGLTQSELAARISKAYEEAEILAGAKVQVTILALHPMRARVLGSVNRPGEIDFKPGDTLLDAIAKAGSYQEDALLDKSTLTRKGSKENIAIDLKKMFKGDLSQNMELAPGDTIYVPPAEYANKIYILGQVLRPGIYPLKDRMTVLSAIGLASGPTERGELRSTVIVRGGPDKPQRVPCNVARLLDKADMSQDIELQAGDTIIVPETRRPDWTKISQLLSTVMNLTYIRRYGLF